jgi:FMN-dependent NADH-azoreductase
MSKLLYIQASPRGERSFSTAAADAFVAAYREANPGDEVVTLNLFDTDLPAFDGGALGAKYAILGGQSPDDAEAAAWRPVEAVIETFKSADKYVFAVPMWNFGIPYRLKHFIDVIVQPGYTFSYSPEEGYTGLVTGKPVFVAYARGAAYPPGSETEPFDLQTKYFELFLGFIGFTDIRRVVVEPTLSDPETAGKAREAAVGQAREAAGKF